MRNEEVLHAVKEDRKVLPAIQRKKVNWIGQILHSNCILKQAIEGNVDRKGSSDGKTGRKT